MKIEDFLSLYTFKQRDKEIAKNVYKSLELTEEEWVEKLKPDFEFNHQDFYKAKKLAKIKELKEAKLKAKTVSEEDEEDEETIVKEEAKDKTKSKSKKK